MTRDEAIALINVALDRLILDDAQLLKLRICEMALHFRIAHYMAQSGIIKPPLTLDCEYNRHLGDEKRLNLPGQTRSPKVFPDILVHERNSDENNMLVLELKRPGLSLVHDSQKLRAYHTQLHYRHAGHVIIGQNRLGELIREIKWIDG